MTIWDELRQNIIYWLRNRRSADGPRMVPLHEFGREVSLRLCFETRYYLLAKKTGRAVSVAEARAWLLDQDDSDTVRDQIAHMHTVLIPDAYEPFLTEEF
jgi:hypothetical protein